MYRTVEVEVDVDLEDFDTEDLIDELERRDRRAFNIDDVKLLVQSIYDKRRLKQDYQEDLTNLIWETIGRIS
jgi:hypothetical protein